jgi:hypothetical protein
MLVANIHAYLITIRSALAEDDGWISVDAMLVANFPTWWRCGWLWLKKMVLG